MNYPFNSPTHALAWLNVHGLVAEVRHEIEEGDDEGDDDQTIDYIHLKRRHGLTDIQQDWSKQAINLLVDEGMRVIWPPDDLFGAQRVRGRILRSDESMSYSYGGSIGEARAPEPSAPVVGRILCTDEGIEVAADTWRTASLSDVHAGSTRTVRIADTNLTTMGADALLRDAA